jgi:hypothetical protein
MWASTSTNLQRSVNDMEELVWMHDLPYGVPDRKGAVDMGVTAGEIAFEDVTFHYGGHHDPLYRDFSLTHPWRREGRPRRPLGLRQDDLRQAGAAALRRDRRPYRDRRAGYRRCHAGVFAPADRDRAAGAGAVPPLAGRRTSPMAGRVRALRRSSRRRSSPTRMSSSCACPRATPRSSASAASSSRAASASVSRWLAPSWPTRRS